MADPSGTLSPAPAAPTAGRPQPPPSRIPTSTSREHILTESSSGWSPLRIAKQRPAGPLRGSSSLSANEVPLAENRPRRTSNSYKHLKSNSLVSNSPFKQEPSPRQPGIGGGHSDGESPKRTGGSGGTFGLGIGLGQSPARRSPGRRSSKDGGRRMSGSGGIENEPLSSGESSDDNENDVPGAVATRQADFRRRTKGRQSAGLATLGSKAKVTNSPFLALSLSPPPSATELALLPLPALSPSNEDTTPSLSETSSFPSPLLASSSLPVKDGSGSPPSLKPTPTSEPIALPLLTPLTPTKPHANVPAHVAPDAPPTPSPKSSMKSHPRQAASAGRPARQPVVRERRKTVTFDERPEISVFEREASAELSSAVGSDDDDDDDEYGEPFPAVGSRRGPPAQEQEYSYELSPSLPQQGSDDEAGDFAVRSDTSFEFDLSPARGLAQAATDAEDDPLGNHRLANLSLGSYSSDYSLNELDLGRSADDDEDPEDFVNRLLAENQLLSPVPATQTVFERYSADAEEVFGADDDANDALALGPVLGAGSNAGQSSGEPSPALRHVELPHLRASVADPILMNGNVLEPSAVRGGSSGGGLTRSRSSKASLLAVDVGVAAEGEAPLSSPHAHQSGPLPDPFLTVKTVQDIVNSPAHGRRPAEEGGVPLGRSHHSERHRAVGELREGLGSSRLAQAQSPIRAPAVDREGADVFGEKLALVDSPAKATQPPVDRSLAPLSPYSLPSLTSQSPLLFGSFEMATPDPAAGASTAEFGGGFQYRPSSSLERFQQGEPGGSVGSSGGRSPRLTKESIRRRMELKAAAAAGGSASASKPDAVASRGLGLGLPERAIAKGVSTPSGGSPVKKDKPLPPAPTSAERPPRPTVLTSTRAPSAEEILSKESALGKLAARSSTSPVDDADSAKEATHSLKEGSGKGVLISPVSATFAEASSTAVEEASAPVTSIPRSMSRAALDAQLMPPPPLPLSRAPSPTPNVIRAPSPASSAQSQSGDEGVAARHASIDGGSASRRSRPRRSLSHGDVTEEGGSSTQAKTRERRMGRLSIGPAARNSANLSELNQEFERIGASKNKRYTVIEHEPIYAASDEKVSHSARSGDLDRGKAWRSVKRPSDMNEYADEIREIRMREKPGRAHAKVFVKIVGMSDLTVPLQSSSQSSFRIALNNGLHSVETSSYPLRSKVEIGQEFELLGLENLEFSLAIKVKKDNHIATRLKALNPPAPEAPATPSKKESGFRKLMSSPRRTPKASPIRPAAEEPPQDELVRYLSPDGTLATVKIVFKDIAARCNGQLLSLHLPLSGKWNDDSLAYSSRFASSAAVRRSKTIGRLELQLIMIPSLPGLTQDQLPQSLEDAVVGLRHVRWHKMDYYAGTLTQLGGDCSSWRRRRMRIVGGLLEATSDITDKITARIDLAKMTAIRDYNAEEEAGGDIDRPMSVERSFGLVFDDGDEIQFFADRDEDKADWLAHLNELLGRVPSLPLWSELLWVKQQQQQQQAASGVTPTSQPPAWR